MRRQDRKDKPRVPISAKLVANLVSAAGANRVLTMDLHKAQIQGFFDIPVDHLFATPVFIELSVARAATNGDVTIVSPDAGGVERARAYAKRLHADLAIIDKRRSGDGHAEVMNVVGDVEGRTCILLDDLVDTAGTLAQASGALRRNGAASVIACAVHGVLSGPALQRIEEAELEQPDCDRHDPAASRVRSVLEDPDAVGGSPAGQGDREHPPGDVGFVAVRVGCVGRLHARPAEVRGKEPRMECDIDSRRPRRRAARTKRAASAGPVRCRRWCTAGQEW